MSTPGGADNEMRVGDAERDASVSCLGEHYAAGRLTKEEYDERAERAWAARTGSDLTRLFTDLPDTEVYGTAHPRPGAQEDASPWRGRRPWPGVPWLPVLVGVVAVAALTHLWPLLLVLVVLRCTGVLRPRRWEHAHGPHAYGPGPHRR
ncbi:MAG: DUF1707 SHOCT-like domain-containing protein [Nocardioidaceae bacterium]